jgi:hypothetical protein
MSDGYDVRYVIVAGRAWLRCTRGAPAGEAALWLATFDGEPHLHKRVIANEEFGDVPLSGEVGGVSWELEIEELAAPFRTPHRALRKLTPSGMETWPALKVSGRVGEQAFDSVPGHRARLWGRRHARSWGWAHGSTSDGNWVHLLSVRVSGLPRLSQHASHRGGPGLPLARAELTDESVRIGPFVAEAPADSFLEVTYNDPDGSPVTCLHSERGRIHGAGIELVDVAVELGHAT